MKGKKWEEQTGTVVRITLASKHLDNWNNYNPPPTSPSQPDTARRIRLQNSREYHSL